MSCSETLDRGSLKPLEQITLRASQSRNECVRVWLHCVTSEHCSTETDGKGCGSRERQKQRQKEKKRRRRERGLKVKDYCIYSAKRTNERAKETEKIKQQEDKRAYVTERERGASDVIICAGLCSLLPPSHVIVRSHTHTHTLTRGREEDRGTHTHIQHPFSSSLASVSRIVHLIVR